MTTRIREFGEKMVPPTLPVTAPSPAAHSVGIWLRIGDATYAMRAIEVLGDARIPMLEQYSAMTGLPMDRAVGGPEPLRDWEVFFWTPRAPLNKARKNSPSGTYYSPNLRFPLARSRLYSPCPLC